MPRTTGVQGVLSELPATFTYSNAREAGLSEWRLYALMRDQRIERIGRGLYRRTDAPTGDRDLIEIAQRAPLATLCLTTALSRHDLSDAIPARIDVAVSRGPHAGDLGARHLAQVQRQHLPDRA